VILRGLSKQSLVGEILSILLPIGELKDDLLAELAACPSPRAAIDLLASMGSHFARPLIRLRANDPGVGINEMELALDCWFFQETFQYLQNEQRAGKLLFSAMQLEADIQNLLTVLRFAHSPKERKFLREFLHTDELEQLLVGPGKISFAMLISAGNQDQVSAAVDILTNTPYNIPLKNGLKAYKQSILLSDIEKQLKRFRLTWMSRQIYKDPLGIGVLLGYVALKINEISNIRWVAQGINLNMQAESIRKELEYPQ
jgi:vacuolar-type H+-ATPase subunit C/Vma6